MNSIEHQGIVENTDGTYVQVRILQTSACASCAAKTFCSSGNSKEKIIEIDTSNGNHKVGDRVIILSEMSVGMKAVFISFVIPFFILIVSLFVLMSITDKNELLSASLSLLFLIPYYVILRMKRNYLKKELSFSIKN
jgi:sigma-E factor negative regulatory protein RseC